MTTALPARCPTPVAPLPPRGSAQTLTLSMPIDTVCASAASITSRGWSVCQRIQLKYLLDYTYIVWSDLWSPHRSPSINAVSESVLLLGHRTS